MDAPWPCGICARLFAEAKTLAEHLLVWHQEWLDGNRIPPPLRVGEVISEFW